MSATPPLSFTSDFPYHQGLGLGLTPPSSAVDPSRQSMIAEGPLAFPSPLIKQAVVRKVQVVVSQQDIVERAAIESASGRIYELGRRLK